MAQINPQTANPAQPQTAPDTLDAAPDTMDAAAAPDTLDAAPVAPPPDPNKVLASTKYAGAPSTEAPGSVQRAMENSGAAGLGNLIGQTGGYIGTMPGRTMNRVTGLQEAYDALKHGDLKKASMIAHTLATGPDDPITAMAKNIIKMPFEEAVEAYKALRNQNVDDPTAYLEAAQHGIRAVPVIGAGAEQVGANIAEDFHNNNWSGLSGDIVGILPALLFGEEGKAAQAAETSGAEGAAEAAEMAKKNAIRPSQRMIGRTPVPVTALQDNPTLGARALKTMANDPAAAQARFIAERTQPAAATAAVTSLEDVARKHIQMVREELGDHSPFEGDMSTIGKQANAMRDSASEIYKKFDAASNEEQEAYKTQTNLDKEEFEKDQVAKEKAFDEEQATKKEAFEKSEQGKVEASAAKAKANPEKAATPYKAKPFKAEKFEGEDFEPEDRPLTFDELQHQRKTITKAMANNSMPWSQAEDALNKVNQEMDDFAERHSDVVSPEEYKLANNVYSSATKHDFIANRLKINVGTDEIPASISKDSLKNLEQAFDSNKKFGPDAFRNYLGPQGYANFNAIRNVLENPAQASLFMRFAKGLMGEAAAGALGAATGTGTAGTLTAMGAKYTMGQIAENLLFNPEYGQTVLAAYRAAHNLGRPAAAVVRPAAMLPKQNTEATHTWSPEQGVTPIQ
jgi:hypothetical protein